MSYNYSHIQQGFTGSGGVPYNGMPTLPQIVSSSKMDEHLPAIASAIYADMNRRNTKITTYLANAMGCNTFHNETFTLALQLSADYVEYLLGAKMMPLPQAINTAVPLVNDFICYNYIAQAPNARDMASQNELSTYSVAAEKIKSLKPEIKNYLTRGNTTMYPQQQYPQQGFPMQQPYPQQGYPQQPFPGQFPGQQFPQQGYQGNPAGSGLLQRALARGGIGLAPQSQQQYQGQPQMGIPQQFPQQGFPMGQPGFPQQQFPQQGYNPAMQQMQTAQAVQQAWGQPQQQYNPGFPQQQFPQQQYQGNRGYNPAMFATNTPTQNPVSSPRAPVQGYPSSVQNAGNIWTANPNLIKSQQQEQQMVTRPASQPYVPDMSGVTRPQQPVQPSQSTQSRPVQQAPNFSQQVAPKPQGQQTYGYQPQPSPPGTLVVDPELTRYEQRVRAFAKEKGLPWNDQSVEALEWAITNMYPDNGFIDPNNPYRLRCMPKPTGSVQPMTNRQEVNQFINRTTDDDLKAMAAQSKGELVKNAKGEYVWLKEAGNPASAVTGINFSSAPEAIRNHVSGGRPQPYPFAKLNSKGEWFITEKEFYTLPLAKRPMPYDGTIGKCMMRDLYFIVDDNGVVTKDFSVVKPEYQSQYEDLIMNKEQHNYTRFFNALTPRDNVEEIDYNKAIEAFANAQTQTKVKELIETLEADSNAVKENGVLQITGTGLQSTNIVVGETLGDDYVSHAYTTVADLVDDKAEVDNCTIRYVHANLNKQLQIDELAKVAKGLNTCTKWKEIVNVLNEMSEFDNTGIATILNERATNYVNNMLISMFNIYPTDFYMESFHLDILDVEEEMEKRGLDTQFNKLVTKMVASVLYCFDRNSNLFKEVLGTDENDEYSELVTFGIVRDVTVLPIHSNLIALDSNKKRAVVTEGSAPQLYTLIKKTVDSAHPRSAEIILVTSDNRVMYVNRTANSNSFAVTQHSVLEPTVH